MARGESFDAFDAAHDYADGCSAVIYYYRARQLFDDSSDVYNREDEVSDYVAADASINDRIAVCAYLAVRDAFTEACEELAAIEVPTVALRWRDGAGLLEVATEYDAEQILDNRSSHQAQLYPDAPTVDELESELIRLGTIALDLRVSA